MTTTSTGRSEGGAGPAGRPPVGAAFLLAQIGAHAARAYAQRVAQLGLSPAQTGVLRLVAQDPGRSQQALAAQLGVAPSKVVALVDGLEEQGLLRRTRSSTDRRQYALHLTDPGHRLLADVGGLAAQHEADLTAALDDEERHQLLGLLQRVADEQGLTPGVHPGYRDPPGG